MKNLILVICLLSFLKSPAQFYYNDLVDAATLSQKMKVYEQQQVKSAAAVGYDPQGARSSDFNETQYVNLKDHQLRVITRNGQNFTRLLYVFDATGNLSVIKDSSGGIHSTTNYTYNSDNQITNIKRVVIDSANDFSRTEEHIWKYSGKSPLNLWTIINSKDSSEYRFTLDENKNVAEEQLYRRGVGLDITYYYYDDAKHLTDIARFDRKVKKILPDFMFEYDEQDRVIQKITTLSVSTRDYLIWRYVYNDKGLKTKEVLFNKRKEQTGRIDYAYGL